MAELHALSAEPLGIGLIEVLEEALAQARAGQLSAVAIAKVDRGGAVSGTHSKLPSRPVMLGALAFLTHDIISADLDD
jgi:hypothetical protein